MRKEGSVKDRRSLSCDADWSDLPELENGADNDDDRDSDLEVNADEVEDDNDND